LKPNAIDKHLIGYIIGFFLGAKFNNAIIDKQNQNKYHLEIF